jgi:hypothetical protein
VGVELGEEIELVPVQPFVSPRQKKQARRRHLYREQWVAREKEEFQEGEWSSTQWDEACQQGSWEEKVQWIREDDVTRCNWEPIFQIGRNKKKCFMGGKRTPLPLEDLEEEQGIEYGATVWERELGNLDAQLDMEDVVEELSQEEQDRAQADILSFLKAVYPTMGARQREQLVHEMVSVGESDELYGPQHALQWAKDFQLPQSVVCEDEKLIADCGYEWKRFVKKKREPQKSSRLSEERLDKLDIKSSEDKVRLRRLATTGMSVPTDSFWCSNFNKEYPECGPAYKEVSSAVIKMFYDDYWRKGQGFFVSADTARKLKVNTSVASWTPKQNKLKGRPISNFSRVSPGMIRAINSVEVRDKMQEEWGSIRHPTIDTIVRMILKYLRDHPSVSRADLELWSTDLAGAFTLLDVNVDDIKKVRSNDGKRFSLDIFGRKFWLEWHSILF